MKTIQYIQSGMVLCGLLAVAACATDSKDKDPGIAAAQSGKVRKTAVAVLAPAPNGKVHGQVTFTEEVEGVRVNALVEGLTPGLHGFHIHQKGDCSAPDFSSAGGHFNPLGRPHGSPTDPEHHTGDFGNLEANEQGVARYERVFPWLTMEGENSIIGHAVIIHEKADDLKSQPAGNAGSRLACGVIQQTSK